jgi:hypothetical protein
LCEAVQVGLAPLPLAFGAYPDFLWLEIASHSSHHWIANASAFGETPVAEREFRGIYAQTPAPVAASARSFLIS